jgi:hypothetical protein
MIALKNKAAYDSSLLKMDSDVYSLRRRVMDVLYKLKGMGYMLPRQEVRIVQDCNGVYAYAYLGANVMHFDLISYKCRYDFEVIVLHELVHSTFAVGRIEGCPLMDCNNITAGIEEAYALFDVYYKNQANN